MAGRLPGEVGAAVSGRYSLSREQLLERRIRRAASAAIRFATADAEVQRVRREVGRKTPECGAALRARKDAKVSLLYHARELRKVRGW